jgi:hypothetical protein
MIRKQIPTTIANGSSRCVLMLKGKSSLIKTKLLSMYWYFAFRTVPASSPTNTDGIKMLDGSFADIGSENKEKAMFATLFADTYFRLRNANTLISSNSKFIMHGFAYSQMSSQQCIITNFL